MRRQRTPTHTLSSSCSRPFSPARRCYMRQAHILCHAPRASCIQEVHAPIPTNIEWILGLAYVALLIKESAFECLFRHLPFSPLFLFHTTQLRYTHVHKGIANRAGSRQKVDTWSLGAIDRGLHTDVMWYSNAYTCDKYACRECTLCVPYLGDASCAAARTSICAYMSACCLAHTSSPRTPWFIHQCGSRNVVIGHQTMSINPLCMKDEDIERLRQSNKSIVHVCCCWQIGLEPLATCHHDLPNVAPKRSAIASPKLFQCGGLPDVIKPLL